MICQHSWNASSMQNYIMLGPILIFLLTDILYTLKKRIFSIQHSVIWTLSTFNFTIIIRKPLRLSFHLMSWFWNSLKHSSSYKLWKYFRGRTEWLMEMKLETLISRERKIFKIYNNQFPCCTKHSSFGWWILEIKMEQPVLEKFKESGDEGSHRAVVI